MYYKGKITIYKHQPRITTVRCKKYRQQDQLQAFSVRLALTSITRKKYRQKTINSENTSLCPSILKALTTLPWH
jgi:hypothetical protein